MNIEYSRGWYAAMDRIMNYINSLDSSEMTTKEVRSRIYRECMSLVP